LNGARGPSDGERDCLNWESMWGEKKTHSPSKDKTRNCGRIPKRVEEVSDWDGKSLKC